MLRVQELADYPILFLRPLQLSRQDRALSLGKAQLGNHHMQNAWGVVKETRLEYYPERVLPYCVVNTPHRDGDGKPTDE
jgi:hypothetical protein